MSGAQGFFHLPLLFYIIMWHIIFILQHKIDNYLDMACWYTKNLWKFAYKLIHCTLILNLLASSWEDHENPTQLTNESHAFVLVQLANWDRPVDMAWNSYHFEHLK